MASPQIGQPVKEISSDSKAWSLQAPGCSSDVGGDGAGGLLGQSVGEGLGQEAFLVHYAGTAVMSDGGGGRWEQMAAKGHVWREAK